MKRQDKYPDTDTFHYHNANPKNRMTGDCAYRAISVAVGQDYNETVMEMAQMHCETGYEAISKKGIENYLKKLGWVKHPQPKHDDGTKYTGAEFCRELSEEIYCGRFKSGSDPNRRIIANIGGHHIVAIIDGKIWDTWDSSGKCVGNYWTKR